MDSQLPKASQECNIYRTVSFHSGNGFFMTFLMVFLLLAAPRSHAATYYVSPSGSDQNAGTSAAPFKTIARTCSGLLKPGDTVVVKDGLYTVGSMAACDLSGAGSSSGWITFVSEHKWGAKLNGNNNSSSEGFDISASSYIRVKDFEIYGFGGSGVIVENGSATSPSTNIEITGNKIHDIGRSCSDSDTGRDGIFVGKYASSVLINKNVIYNIGRYAPGENGCQPATQYYMNHDHGLYLAGVDRVTVVNNIFYNNVRGWDIQVYNGSGAPLLSNALIAHNTFSSNNPYRVGQVLLSYPGANTTTIQNNIFNLPNTQGVSIGSSAVFSNVNVNNNMVNGGAINGAAAAGVTFSNNKVSTDPKFVNAGAYDFHLQNISPAINTGVSVPQVTEDFDGNGRSVGSVYDMGALQYTGTAFYGSGLGADSLGLTVVGGPLAQKVSHRFLSTRTGLLSSITWYQLMNGSGNSAGTNGQIQAQIVTDDGTAAHNPSSTVLASNVVSSVCNGSGSGCAVTLPFISPASLVSGTLYHVVFSNVDPNPTMNYSSMSSLYYPSSNQPSVNSTNLAVLMYTVSAGWKMQTGFTSMMQFSFADGITTGQSYGNPYSQWIQNISGQNSVREQFTVSGSNKQVNSASFRLSRLSGTDPLAVSLELSDGTVIEQGTISALAIPSNVVFNPSTGSNWASPQWVAYTFKSLRTLSVGQTYNFVLSAPSTSVYTIFPIEKGKVRGFNSATDFSDGFFQFNNGSGWTGGPLTGVNSNSSDLQFYMTLRPAPVGTNTLNVSTVGSGFGMVFGSNNLINCGVNPGATQCAATVFGGTAVTLTAVPASGSTFANWTIVGSSAGTCTGATSPCTLTVNANTTVASNFTATAVQPTTVAITASAGSNGAISPSGVVSVNYGASQIFTVTPNTGYNASLMVDGVAVSLTNNAYNLSNVTAAHTVTASFSIQTNTLTSTAGSNGVISPAGAVSVNYGASQTFTVTPNSGYNAALMVDGVAVSLTNNTYTLSNVTAAHTVSASFTAQAPIVQPALTLTVSAGSGGTISPTGTVSVNYGASKTFTVTANSGYRAILRVDGNRVTLSSNNTYTLSNVTANHTVSVRFRLI